MRHILLPLTVLAALASAGQAAAKSTALVIDELKFEQVHEAAQRGVLAMDAAGKPLTFLLKIKKGGFLPPHGESGGLRLLTVLSGDLSWGDGDRVDRAAERIFAPGSVIVVPAEGGQHWAAARAGEVLLQVVVVRDGALSPQAAAQVR